MSTETQTPSVEKNEAAIEPKAEKKAAPKAAKKTAKKKAAKKATKKVAKKADKKPAAAKRRVGTGITGNQINILKALKKLNFGANGAVRGPATMDEIAAKAGDWNVTTVRMGLGSPDPKISKKIAEKYHPGRPCLLDSGLVKHVKDEGRSAYTITKKGLDALASA